MMKNILVILVILLTVIIFYFNNTENEIEEKEYNVGLVYLLDHPAIQQGIDGFNERLRELEKAYSTKINVTYSNAYGEIKNINSIVNSFKSNKDIIIALTTPVAQISKKVITDKPVIFVGVTDPVSVGLVDSLNSGKDNVTGTTSQVDYKKILELYIALYPDRKRIGIVYSQQESNSVSIIKRIKNIIKDSSIGIQLITKSIVNTNDIFKVTNSLANDVDSIMLINDNAVISGLKIVLKVAEDKNLPIFASDIDSVKNGALFTYGLNYKDEGIASANLLEQVLFKKQEVRDIPVFINKKSYLFLNEKIKNNPNLKEEILKNATFVGKK